MTVLSGATLISPSGSYGARVTTDLDDIFANWSPGFGSRLVGGSPVGTLTRNVAAGSNRTITGIKARSYLDDFYYRVHVIPGNIDVGFLVGDSVRNVILWNAHFTSKSYTGLTATGTDGITLSPPVGPPYNMNALEEQVFPFTIKIDGPPTINAVYTWVVGGEAVQLKIKGERTVPFAFPPNWSEPVAETLSFLTNVLSSRDGTEQRVALRSKPRRSFAYRMHATGSEWTRLQNSLWGWHKYTFAVPIWTDVTSLSADAAVGTSVIELDTTSRGFAVDGQALLWADANNYEVVTIDSLTDTALTLKRVTQKAWPRLTRVYPIALGHLPTSVPVSKVTDNVAMASVTMNLDPVRTDPRLPVVAAALTHNNHEVMLTEPNWSGELDNSSVQDFGEVDNMTGARTYLVTQQFSRVQRGFRWLLDGKAQIDSFRALLLRMNGRQKSVYIPTFTSDMVLLDNALGGDLNIKVACPKLAPLVGANKAYERIMIEMLDGTRYFHRITSVKEDNSGSQLVGLSPALSTSIVPGNVRRISFMPLFRLSSDDVVLNWVTDSVVTVEASFTLVTE